MKHWDVLQVSGNGQTHKVGMVIAGSYQAALAKAKQMFPNYTVDVEES